MSLNVHMLKTLKSILKTISGTEIITLSIQCRRLIFVTSVFLMRFFFHAKIGILTMSVQVFERLFIRRCYNSGSKARIKGGFMLTSAGRNERNRLSLKLSWETKL